MNPSKILLSLAVLASGLFFVAPAQAADDYYKGKMVTAYVGYAPGGSNDVVTRAVAQFIGKHMGGNPGTIVKNMPGAVTRTLASYLWTQAPKDGTEFGNIDRQIMMAALLDPTIKEPFDMRQFTWLGSPLQETLTCVSWHTSPVQTIQDLQTKEFLTASPAGNSGESLTEQLMNKLMGAKIKLIHGYAGGAEMNLAMQRGEVHGRCGIGWESAKACCSDFLKAGQMKVLIQLSVNKNPELANVPSLIDVPMSDADRQALGLIYASQQFGRPFAAPPNMPPDRKAALKKAFADTMKDPEFAAHMAAQKFNLNPLTGEDIDRIMTAAYTAPKAVLDRAIELGKAN
jgi:tripartite-type tricarboxylate transporter receptor subunit TctC